MSNEPKFGAIKSFTKDEKGHDNALAKLEKLNDVTFDDALFLIYNWVRRNEISEADFKFLLKEIQSNV
jgi:hypothetical protein